METQFHADELPSTWRTANTHVVSLRDRSTEDLTQAIRLPGDEAFVLDRARVTLRLFYDPDMSDMDRAEMLEEFGRALKHLPKWAVSQAFDRWNREQRRRPSPADIVALAGQALRRVTDELAERRRAEAPPALSAPVRADLSPEDLAAMAERAQRIIEEAGFTARRLDLLRRAPTARSDEEAEARTAPFSRHWTEGAAPDSPAMKALHRARATNEIVQAAQADLKEQLMNQQNGNGHAFAE